MMDIANRVRNVVAKECHIERTSLGFSDDLTEEHGVDDLDLMKIAMRLEDVFGVEVSDEAFQQERTVARCVQLVREAMVPA
jgi:acyl carrier protein